MRTILIAGLFAFAATAHASSTLRVGNRVLTAGDSTERVTELLGKPSSKSHRHSSHASSRRSRGTRVTNNADQAGEQWRYRRDGRSIVVTIVDGRVSDIDDQRI
jgi:hypothetical protein